MAAAATRISILENRLRHLVDDIITISVKNLPRRSPVTLLAQICENNINYSGFSHNESRSCGSVRLDRDPSHGGSYTGVDPMGLFWSTSADPGHRKGVQLLPRDVTKPMVFKVKVFQGHLNLDNVLKASENDLQLCSLDVNRWYMGEGVVRQPIRGAKIRGTLFYPNTMGRSKFPAVIDIPGAGGGCLEHRAALLASRGFMVLALAVYRYQDLPKNRNFVDLDYMEEAVEFMSNHEYNLSSDVGTIANSTGADISTKMSILFPKITASVLINGSGFHTYTPMVRHGLVVSTYCRMDWRATIRTKDGVEVRNGFPSMETIKEFGLTFPVEKSSAEYLIINCKDDRQFGIHAVDILPRRLAIHGEGGRARCMTYQGAGHLLEPPYTPVPSASYLTDEKTFLVNGGEPKCQNEAQVHSWKLIQDFLRNTLTVMYTRL